MTTVKIIVMTIVLVLLAVFCGSNTANACKISFLWFSTPNDIPVFVSMLLSFVAGVVVMIPVMLFHGFSIKKRFSSKAVDEAAKANDGAAAIGEEVAENAADGESESAGGEGERKEQE
mgnify:CR=1 FL=1